MPFKSEAQRRKFYAMERRGEISKETLDKWVAETPKGKKLPKRLKKKASLILQYIVRNMRSEALRRAP